MASFSKELDKVRGQIQKRPCQIMTMFFRKDHVKSLSEQNFKKINIKNIKMKPPVALFKKKSRKLCLFLKAKSQNLINTVVRCLHKEKDVKKTVKRKIGKVRVF